MAFKRSPVRSRLAPHDGPQPREDGNEAPAIGTQKVSVQDHRDGLSFAAASAHVVPRRVYISLESERHSLVGRH